jgi:hypothetical protein
MLSTWSGHGAWGVPLAAAAIGLGLGVAVGASLSLPATWRTEAAAPSATAQGGRLSADDERRLGAILDDARVTRAAATAYFSEQGDALQHAEDVDELVDGTIRARVVELLGPGRAAVAARSAASF